MKVYVVASTREIPCEPTTAEDVEAVFSTEALAQAYCKDRKGYIYDEWEMDEEVEKL